MGMKRKSVAECITGCGCACTSLSVCVCVCVCVLQQALAPDSGKRPLCAMLMYLYSQVGDMVALYAGNRSLFPLSKDEYMDVTGACKHAFIMLFLICISIRRRVKFVCLDDIFVRLLSL